MICLKHGSLKVIDTSTENIVMADSLKIRVNKVNDREYMYIYESIKISVRHCKNI